MGAGGDDLLVVQLAVGMISVALFSLLLTFGLQFVTVVLLGLQPPSMQGTIERLIADLSARGIHAAEFIPIRNSPETLSLYVHALRGAGFVVTAGTGVPTSGLVLSV